MNEFDITECTGPFECENFKRFGYTVGCENWVAGSPANFPHQKWRLNVNQITIIFIVGIIINTIITFLLFYHYS